ncbi:Bacteriophage T4, Gp19, tail tube [uncultured Caudovirales phage]|uniref:Bacteriophage T4, Gp19, tail tube n=1 Tax=uncultured Caudovirales phage TaxID=2100421 RepID=A0A6J5MBT6_9CAUD|nr:Bacteriophage T4, Gp19, tail tube [uncultured Caudovirales phage]
MFRIRDFTASINTSGVLKNNKYIASVTLPPGHYLSSELNTGDNTLFSIRCDSVQLPGVAIASADGPPRLGYGPIEKHPYNANFEDVALTFIVDANSRIHRMLHKWVNVIVNFEHSKGTIKGAGERGGTMGASGYEVGYRNKYAADIQIDVYRDTGRSTNEKTMTYKLYNAFPMAFPSAGLNWNEGDILRINIPFAYTDYSVEYETYNDRPNERLPRTQPTETGETDREVAGITEINSAFNARRTDIFNA